MNTSWGSLQPMPVIKPPSPTSALVHSIPPTPRPTIFPITGHFDSNSGYGTFTLQLCREILRRGFLLRPRTLSLFESDSPVPDDIKSKLLPINAGSPSKWELVVYPCIIQPANITLPPVDIAYMTMWESTRIFSTAHPNYNNAIKLLNRCKVVIVPNSWNATIFSACGINTPIRIAPLCCETDLFQPTPLPPYPFTIGTAARLRGGGVRKGFNVVLRAFQAAFPSERNVRLRVKCFHDDPPIPITDSRIDILNTYISPEKLRDWYSTLHVFASGSSAEGWGRHQHEAMCMGRPVIGANFGGVCEFFNEENGYPCAWNLIPGEGVYESMGHYAGISIPSMAAQMRRAFENCDELARKSKLSIQYGHRFTVANTLNHILEILREFSLGPKELFTST